MFAVLLVWMLLQIGKELRSGISNNKSIVVVISDFVWSVSLYSPLLRGRKTGETYNRKGQNNNNDDENNILPSFLLSNLFYFF
jgi:hypothetical protein